MSLEEVKSYLDENSIEYLAGNERNIFELVFVIDNGSTGSGLSTFRKSILFTVKFDDASRVRLVEKKDVYTGL